MSEKSHLESDLISKEALETFKRLPISKEVLETFKRLPLPFGCSGEAEDEETCFFIPGVKPGDLLYLEVEDSGVHVFPWSGKEDENTVRVPHKRATPLGDTSEVASLPDTEVSSSGYKEGDTVNIRFMKLGE